MLLDSVIWFKNYDLIISHIVCGPNVNEYRRLSKFYIKSILNLTENAAGLDFKENRLTLFWEIIGIC
jgi:hypothetical protein